MTPETGQRILEALRIKLDGDTLRQWNANGLDVVRPLNASDLARLQKRGIVIAPLVEEGMILRKMKPSGWYHEIDIRAVAQAAQQAPEAGPNETRYR